MDGRSCGECGSSSYNWAYRTYVGKDADGRWQEKRKSGFDTKREAERALTEVVSALHNGTFVKDRKISLAKYLRDEWLEAISPPRVRYETWEDRRRNLEHHVIDRIGGVQLQDLNAAHINRLYSQLLADGKVRGDGGLSPTTVRRVHSMLRKALNDAVRWGLIEINPAKRADPPPAKAVKAARRRSMTTWSEEELDHFLTVTEDHRHNSLWFLASTTGLRRSELCGLTWGDIDLDEKRLVVRHTVLRREDGYEHIEEQKSAESARTIHLDDRTLRRLREHREWQDEIREMVGAGWKDHDLVFTRRDGRWHNPQAVTQAFRRRVRRVDEVPYMRFHDLRHTHAMLLLKAGVNPKVVSERLGHSSVSFTLDTYAHVMPGMQTDAAERFSDLVFGTDGDGRAGAQPDDDPDGESEDGPGRGHDNAQDRDGPDADDTPNEPEEDDG